MNTMAAFFMVGSNEHQEIELKLLDAKRNDGVHVDHHTVETQVQYSTTPHRQIPTSMEGPGTPLRPSFPCTCA